MKALILAAGFGVRLREIVHGRPKHLAPVNGQPFLRHLLKLLKKRQVTQIVLSVGYLAQYIIDEFTRDNEGLKIEFSEDERPLGTAGSLKAAQKYLSEDFFVINGDTYLDIDYQKIYRDHQTGARLVSLVVNREINCGIYVVSPKIFDLIPEGTKYSLEKDLLPILFRKNQVGLFKTDQKFIDIGSPEGYAQALKKLK
ncbi:MAG: hypothetical protein UV54_C0031G0007 [Candidatus Beckwithbacteria bacterium GW2011_GWA2_43_10]|uniref:Nucleotidyl transferase domain-containing protein n=1 Tax=Candidatus Beckwithbacteria bacterium GW2011_GWA2_43_10 TaxID=1618369 RepID=A0A0G1E9B9_9BACT|nr:MAG: hypothetical protein UV54_C0031G0007 [Candidatus Beckwithbacteria bacterium GW2011_GWA2_43_10]